MPVVIPAKSHMAVGDQISKLHILANLRCREAYKKSGSLYVHERAAVFANKLNEHDCFSDLRFRKEQQPVSMRQPERV